MNPWLASFLLAGLFFVLLQAVGLIARSKEAISISMDSLATIGNGELSDEQKEERLQANSIALLKLGFSLLLRASLAFAVSAAVAYGLAELGVWELSAVIRVASSGAFLLAALVVGLALVPVVRWFSGGGEDGAGYSASDRMLHRLAFATTSTQVQLANWESRRWAKRLESIDTEHPVFVTGLPRSGTTLALTCLVQMRGLVSHTYRDMPFVLTPCLWDRYARWFRREGAQRERAHGDGMLIDFDSPEALEEMVWMPFWRQQYGEKSIQPWSVDADAEGFVDFLREHMRKVIHLRAGAEASARYVSKNNMNIARLAWLRRTFPQASIVVPFRDPLQHANSLLRQHLRFSDIHQQDAFAAEYMKGLGHFEFGVNLRPIDFDGWLQGRVHEDPRTLGFWVEYWSACYRRLLEEEGIVLFDYDALCRAPEAGLSALADAVGLPADAYGAELVDSIRSAPPREVDAAGVDPEVLGVARQLHSRLVASTLTS